MKEIKVLGIDLAKRSFQLHGVNSYGKTVLRKSLRRNELVSFIADLPKCLIGMEACGGAHHWSRIFRAMGHDVRIMAAQFVKPYVKSNKNDALDAEAICEAVQRPNMRFVAIKEIHHQDIQSMHRARQRLLENRVSLTNEIHGLLGEYGIILSLVPTEFYAGICNLLDPENEQLTTRAKWTFERLRAEYESIEESLGLYNEEIAKIAKELEPCKKLQQVPGIGPLIATALYSGIANPHVFKNGRELAAWLGLVPKQFSTGGKTKLGGISKRGDKYLRTLLIHGARTVVNWSKRKTDSQSQWINKMVEKKPNPMVYVALANKMARVVWVILTKGDKFNANLAWT